jgi:alpha-beta hydrolase superfamily lysophospholipase
MPPLEPFEVVSDGHRLNAGLVVPAEPRGVAVLVHGIPSIAPPEPGDGGYPAMAERFAERGWAGLWVDLRAVRGSEGSFSIEGWVRDLLATLEAARRDPKIRDLPTVVVGSSAGGAVATNAVQRGAEVDGLVLLAAPASWVSFAGDPADALRRITEEAGMEVAPDVHSDPRAWADEFSGVTTVTAIAGARVPMLIVHGTADSVVPVGHANVLAEAAPGAELRIIEGAEHQLRKEPEAVEAVLEWMERVLA